MMRNRIFILLSLLAIFTSCIPGRDNIYDIKAGNFVPDNNPPITSISPGPGIYNQPQSVVMTANESALIYYTLDGSVPTIDSTRYTGYLVIANDSTLKYFAEDDRGNREDVREAAYTFDYSVPMITIVSLPKNSFNTTDTVNISIQGSEFGTVRIMHGGNSIDTGKLVYETSYAGGEVASYSFPATNLQNGTDFLRVYLKDGAGNMGATSSTVTYDGIIPETTANPPSGNYVTLPTSITLSSSETAIIYYTLNTDEPDTSSPQYSEPIPVTGNFTLKYFSVDTAGNEEAVKTAQYLDNSSSTTTASPAGGRYNPCPDPVSLTTTETGADIYYTINGDDPTSGSLFYSGEINIVTDTTLKFISIDRAGNIEAIKTEQYIIDLVNPIISITSVTPAQIGGTESSNLIWSSSEPGLYRVERGGSGWGNGILISSGNYTSGNNNITVPGSSLGEGVNNINVYLKDEAGNIGAGTIIIDRNDIPRNVQVACTYGAGTLTWDPVPAAVSYKLFWKLGTSVSKTDYDGVIENVTSPYSHSGLTDSLTYSWIITAVTALSGEGPSSGIVTGIPQGPVINVREQNGNSIPSGSGSYVMSSLNQPVTLEIQNTGNLSLTINSITKNSGDTGDFTITGPIATSISGGDYATFTISFTPQTAGAKNISIQINNNDVNHENYIFALHGIPAPSNIVKNAGNTYITIGWDPIPGITSYNIYSSASSGVTKQTGSLIANVSNPYTLFSLANDVTSYYVVTSLNEFGESNDSIEIALMPFEWKNPPDLIEGNTGHAYDPVICFDSNNNAIAVWQQNDGTYTSIYTNRYTAGSGWGTAELLETTTGNAGGQQLAVDKNGNAIAVWHQLDGPYYSIYSNRYVPGSGWQGSQLIESAPYDATSPKIAIDGSNNAILVWLQSDGSYDSIYADRYVSGTGWEGRQLIESFDYKSSTSPLVAVNSGGAAFVVWINYQDLGGSSRAVCSNRYIPGTGWGTAAKLEIGAIVEPRIAIDDNNNAIAIWRIGFGTQHANRYASGTGWGSNIVLCSGTTTNDFPQVKMNPNGDAMIVWSLYGTGTYSKRYIAGTGWGSAEVISSPAAFNITMDMNASGTAFVVYMTADYYIESSYNTGSGWNTPQIISTYSGFSQKPSIKVDKNGNALAAWEGDYNGNNSAVVSSYKPGTGWSAQKGFELGTGGINYKTPKISIDSMGNAIVIWEQRVNSYYSIYATQYKVLPLYAISPSVVKAVSKNENNKIIWSTGFNSTSYNIYWSTSPGVTKLNGTKISGVTSPYYHTGLSNYTTYYYIITSQNSQTESSGSMEISSTPSVIIDNEDGTVTDTRSGYMWLKDTRCIGMGTQDDAITTMIPNFNSNPGSCNCTEYTANFTDWHVPSDAEFMTLSPMPAFYPFINPGDWYVSTDIDPYSPGFYNIYRFLGGYFSYDYYYSNHYVIPVRHP